MIILRQKDYSLKGTRLLAGFNKKVLRKAPMKAKRDAIKTQDKSLMIVAKGANKIDQGKRILNEAALNPGQAVSRVTEETLRHPITMGTNIVGKTTMVTDPTGLGLVPLGTIGTAGEVALRKYSPRYAKLTDKAAKKYHGSRVSRGTEKVVNAATGAILNAARVM